MRVIKREHYRSEKSLVVFKDLPASGYEKGKPWRSEEFRTDTATWQLWWYPGGQIGARDGSASLFLHQMAPGVDVEAHYTLTLLKKEDETKEDEELEKMSEYTELGKLSHIHHWVESVGRGWPDFAKKSSLEGGTLYGKVDLETYRPPEVVLKKDLVHALPKDVIVSSCDKTIEANSTVLSLASDVFKAMLNPDHGFKEGAEKRIELESEELEAMIEFINHDGVVDLASYEPTLDKRFRVLLLEADKYQVKGLVKWILQRVTQGAKDDAEHREDLKKRLKFLLDTKHLAESKHAWDRLTGSKEINTEKILELVSTIVFARE